ncbi:MAG: M3 family oligoendopeptidase [Geminicoccaceae bacterium]|nr:M3 family oligoendopeptidase [Geminicoccaceae bacterium]MCB9942947.1 M3 family oligoendopeptidase [Geminicoccaceae bacterium]
MHHFDQIPIRHGESVASRATDDDVPSWDLSDLYAGIDDPQIESDFEVSSSEADALRSEFCGRLADMDGAALARLVKGYEGIQQRLGRVYSFAQLAHSADRDNAGIGQFFQGVQERVNDISTRLLFVTLELNRIEDDRLSQVMQDADLAHYRPWIENVRSYRPHQLDDAIEKTLHEKSVVGRSAWIRLFDETMAGLRFSFDGEELGSAKIFDKLSSRDRAERERAAASIGTTLGKNIRLFARITNTLAKDKQIEDNWRSFAEPISSRNLANQVEDEVVEALISATRDAYPRISHRYYELKRRWMGLDRMQHWDRNAPLPDDDDRRIAFADAKVVVLDAYRTFSPTLADMVAKFFDRRWIDADVRTSKDSGAFCHPTVPGVHPYVLMNFQGRNRDVMTLAHELGHGVHQILAAGQGPLMSHTPLTLAETASVFGEQLTFRAILSQEKDAGRRRLLLASKIEDMINTVVRQIAFCCFERSVHAARRKAELTTEELGEIWMDVQRESLGPAFDFDPGYSVYWSYIPHFIHSPFYVYAYAFGDCLVNALYAVYQQQPEGFEARYLDLLRAGGTMRHKELLAPFGLDASAPDFWAKGLGIIEGLIVELEAELGYAA